MSDNDLTADPELLAGFLDESQESLAGLDVRFVELERNPSNLAVIDAIFRPVHSLKGNAAFFGFIALKQLAHDLENVLDHLRKGRMAADRATIDLLLAGLDGLKGLVAGLKADVKDPADPQAYDDLLARLRTVAITADGGSGVLADLSLVEAAAAHFPDDARAALARIRSALSKQSGAASQPASGPLAELTAIIDAVAAGQANDERNATVPALIERMMADAPAENRPILAEMLEGFNAFFPAMGFDPMLVAYLRERIPKLAAGGSGSRPRSETASRPRSESTTRPRSEGGTSRVGDNRALEAGPKTMRVPESTVDAFLEQVGELVVIGDMYGHLHKRLSLAPESRGMARDLRRANETFSAVSNKLQRGIMALRQVPIRPLLNKVPRLVRDVASARGKDIAVRLEGEDLLVDKTIVELLDAPLTHIARNAADHGIETPERRLATGKPAQGTVVVSATASDRWVTISIVDDGGGINLDGIRAKGEAMGMIAPGAPITEQDIIDLIFAPGVSTAAEVTDISGRGVGMDVVKRAVDESGGSIQVTTERGKGARFLIRVPKGVTTQIMPGYLIRIGGRPFAIPLDRVLETFKAVPSDFSPVIGQGHCIERRGELLTVVSADEILHDRPHDWQARSHVLVAVSANRRKLAVAVDGVLGVQKVVLRQMQGLPGGDDMVAGSALLGDGSLALVLDVDRLSGGHAA
jgi:two-component system chemotaxis sensor kinase CheA